MKWIVTHNDKEKTYTTPRDVYFAILEILGCDDPGKATGEQHAVAVTIEGWCEVLGAPGECFDWKQHGFSVKAIE